MEKKNKLIILIGTLILAVASLYNFFYHLDFFLNVKVAKADVKYLKESEKKDGVIVQISYFNSYLELDTQSIKQIRYSEAKELFSMGKVVHVDIKYTKWTNQTYLPSSTQPAITIFFFDLILFFLVFMGFKAFYSSKR